MITAFLRLARALVAGVASRVWRTIAGPCLCEFCRHLVDRPVDTRTYLPTLDEARRRRGV